MDNVYTERPAKIAMAESGWEEFKRLRDLSADETQALDYIALLHVEHVRKMVAADQIRGDGALIVTDIPDFDLSLVDAHFPSLKARQTTLMSRTGASIVVDILTKQRHIQALRH